MTPARPASSPVVAAAIALLCLTRAASASTVEPLSLADLTQRSQHIFLGRCVHAASEYDGDDIVTRVTFVVSRFLKGPAPGDTLSVLLAGGERDGVRHTIAGMPSFTAGTEVVLFLTGHDHRGRVWPVGLAQGGFRVSRKEGEPPRVRRDFEGLRFHTAGSSRPAAPAPGDMALTELLDAVRELTGETGEASPK